jgi:lipoyl(octanoyl) transferase
MKRNDEIPVEWLISDEIISYPKAIEFMKDRIKKIATKEESELIWLLEHPPLYTAGTSAKQKDLLFANKFEVFNSGRGGQYTYHGPGQRVIYIMLDLTKRKKDIRLFVKTLENWVIKTLDAHNIKGEIRDGRVGVWVKQPEKGINKEAKIAAIGIRLSRWVSFHGISINISPDLSHYDGIVPCGINEHGITSFEDLGHIISMSEVDITLRDKFEKQFGSTIQITNGQNFE